MLRLSERLKASQPWEVDLHTTIGSSCRQAQCRLIKQEPRLGRTYRHYTNSSLGSQRSTDFSSTARTPNSVAIPVHQKKVARVQFQRGRYTRFQTPWCRVKETETSARARKTHTRVLPQGPIDDRHECTVGRPLRYQSVATVRHLTRVWARSRATTAVSRPCQQLCSRPSPVLGRHPN